MANSFFGGMESGRHYIFQFWKGAEIYYILSIGGGSLALTVSLLVKTWAYVKASVFV